MRFFLQFIEQTIFHPIIDLSSNRIAQARDIWSILQSILQLSGRAIVSAACGRIILDSQTWLVLVLRSSCKYTYMLRNTRVPFECNKRLKRRKQACRFLTSLIFRNTKSRYCYPIAASIFFWYWRDRALTCSYIDLICI